MTLTSSRTVTLTVTGGVTAVTYKFAVTARQDTELDTADSDSDGHGHGCHGPSLEQAGLSWTS